MKKFGMALLLLCVFLCTCGKTNWIYVDQSNVSGPWDGTEKNPYKTITAAVQTTLDDETNYIVIRNGTYQEALILKRGTILKAAEKNKNVVLDGGGGGEIVLSMGGSSVDGLIFQNASTGVKYRLDKTYLTAPLQDRTWVCNCKFETSIGVEVEEFGPLSFTSGTSAKAAVWIFDNWFPQKNSGTSIVVDFKGPQTGQLDLELTLANNLISGLGTTGDGISITVTKAGGSLKLSGWINNNLIFHTLNGIRISADNGAVATPEIYGNTIADNIQSGVYVQATTSGGSSTKVNLINNILARNGWHGFVEGSANVTPTVVSHNLFYKNSNGNYKPYGSGAVAVPSGSNNLDASPQFQSGAIYWNGMLISSGIEEGFYYLNQTSSPAVNSGAVSPTQPKIVLFYDGTTNVLRTADTGQRDRGVHYRN